MTTRSPCDRRHFFGKLLLAALLILPGFAWAVPFYPAQGDDRSRQSEQPLPPLQPINPHTLALSTDEVEWFDPRQFLRTKPLGPAPLSGAGVNHTAAGMEINQHPFDIWLYRLAGAVKETPEGRHYLERLRHDYLAPISAHLAAFDNQPAPRADGQKPPATAAAPAPALANQDGVRRWIARLVEPASLIGLGTLFLLIFLIQRWREKLEDKPARTRRHRRHGRRYGRRT